MTAQQVQMIKSSDKAFTLIELLLAFSILVFCLCGILLTYIQMFLFIDLSRDMTCATNAVQAKIEEIKKTSFDSLTIGVTSFNLTDYGYPAPQPPETTIPKGTMEVSSSTSYSDLKKVRIVACFKSRGRIIGNSIDNCTSSPMEVVTLIAR